MAGQHRCPFSQSSQVKCAICGECPETSYSKRVNGSLHEFLPTLHTSKVDVCCITHYSCYSIGRASEFMSDALQVLIAQLCQDNSDQADSYFCLMVSKSRKYFGFYMCCLRQHQQSRLLCDVHMTSSHSQYAKISHCLHWCW